MSPSTATIEEQHLQAGHNRSLDFGLVLLRILPGFMIFHGFKKAGDFDGFVATVAKMPIGELAPTFFAFLVVAGEIVLPILVAVGFFTRISAFLESLMMLFIWLLVPVAGSFAQGGGLFGETGGLVGENAIAFLFALFPLIFTGPGRHSFDHNVVKKAPADSFLGKLKKFV